MAGYIEIGGGEHVIIHIEEVVCLRVMSRPCGILLTQDKYFRMLHRFVRVTINKHKYIQ
jgi:hypothetical protein